MIAQPDHYFDAMGLRAGHTRGILRGNFFLILKRLLKTYSPESFILDHSVNIPDARYTWDGDHPKGIGQDGKKDDFCTAFGPGSTFFY